MKAKRKPPHIDRHGNSIKIGDKVRVIGIPADVRNYQENPADEEELKTKTVFERSFGRTFPIESFDDERVELLVGAVMRRRPYEHSIFLEPEFIELADQGSVQRKAGNFNKGKKNR